MAPISASPAAPRSTHRISYRLSASPLGSKQLAIIVAAVITFVLGFLLVGVYLLHLRRKRLRRGVEAASVVDITDDCASPPESKLADDLVSNAILGESESGGEAKKKVASGFHVSKPPVRSVTGLRTSSLSEMEAERLRFFTFRFPPIEGSDPSVASDASDVLEARTTHDTIAVESAEIVSPPAIGTRPVDATISRKRHDVDRSESTLKRLDAILAQEPTFVVPKVAKILPPVPVDPTRHARVMNMLDDILAQEPPPLSPDSGASDCNDLGSPDLATPVGATNGQDSNNLPPIDPTQFQQLCDEPRTVVLVEASPCLTQRYLVHPVLNTWSKLTGRGDIPLVSHPAIVIEDTGFGELPMQNPSGRSLFDVQTSPEIDYLTPSWSVAILDDDEEEEEEEPVYVPPRIVKTVLARPYSLFVKPRRSQLAGASRPVIGRCIGPGNALGLSVIPDSAPTSGDEDKIADLVVPPRAIIPARPAHKTAVQYGYF